MNCLSKHYNIVECPSRFTLRCKIRGLQSIFVAMRATMLLYYKRLIDFSWDGVKYMPQRPHEKRIDVA